LLASNFYKLSVDFRLITEYIIKHRNAHNGETIMATYFHGTTQQGLNAIAAGAGKTSGPWTCSDQDRMAYLWDAAAMVEGEDLDDNNAVIRQAFESAQVQAAVLAEDTILYVLELEIDADMVEPDYSCENMHYAVTINEDNLQGAIVRAYRCEFTKWDAPFVLSSLLGRDHFAECNVADERLLTLAQTLADQNVFREDLFEFEWEACDLVVPAPERSIAA
jgi:hypothetical protein